MDSLKAAYDLIVVGSGAGGLVTALAAARGGCSVLVLEKSGELGGTSAVSAGTVWIPANADMIAAGIADSPEQAADYLEATVGCGEVGRAFLDQADAMLAFLRETTPIELTVSLAYPDYKLGLPGSSRGRAMQPGLYDTNALGAWRDRLRRDTHMPQYSMAEFKEWGAWANFPWDDLKRRGERGIVSRGAALVGPILQACLENGVDVAVDMAVEDLVVADGKVGGVVTGGRRIAASRGVVLACGGFEWDAGMSAEHLGRPIPIRCSPPHNTGDGHRMAARVGAAFADMDQVWWAPMVAVPGQDIDGEAIGRHIRAERQAPGVIIVDGDGERIVNEAQDYNSLIRAAWASAERKGRPLRLFTVFDRRFLERYGFLTYAATDILPEWVVQRGSLGELAEALGMAPAVLEATVARFNGVAESGEDKDFGRGDTPYDRYGGDPTNPYPNANLAPIEIAPFYGVEFLPGAFGTAGGIVTDASGRALRSDRSVIEGLFAVGNVTAHPLARGYPGAGATLGPAMALGYAIGRHVAGERG